MKDGMKEGTKEEMKDTMRKAKIEDLEMSLEMTQLSNPATHVFVQDASPASSPQAIQQQPDQPEASVRCWNACERAHELLLRLGFEPV